MPTSDTTEKDRPFKLGWDAGARGHDEDASPYPHGSSEHRMWNEWRLVSITAPRGASGARRAINLNVACNRPSDCLVTRSSKSGLCRRCNAPVILRRLEADPDFVAERNARATATLMGLFENAAFRSKIAKGSRERITKYNAKDTVREQARYRLQRFNRDPEFIAHNRAAISASFEIPGRRASRRAHMIALNRNPEINAKRRRSRIAHGREISPARSASIADAIANSSKTYKQIAKRRKVSYATVVKIAKEFGVQRFAAKRRHYVKEIRGKYSGPRKSRARTNLVKTPQPCH